MDPRKAREFRNSAARLRELWRAVVAGDAAAYPALLDLISSLAISGASFGHAIITQQAARLSLALQVISERQFRGDLRPLNAGIDGLEAELLRASHQGSTPNPTAPRLFHSDARTVFVYDGDELHAEWLSSLLVKENYFVRRFSHLSELEAAVAEQLPMALVLSMDRPLESIARELPLVRLRARLGDSALIVISDQPGLSDRINAVRAGVDYYLPKPLDVHGLISLMEDLVEKGNKQGFRVICATADPNPLAEALGVLQHAGMQVRVIQECTGLHNVISEFSPDLLLLDGDFPGAQGVEVAATIRQQTDYANLPVILVVRDAELRDTLRERLPGDSVLVAPVIPSRLLANIRSQVRRSHRISQYVRYLFREIRHREYHDALTGLPNRHLLDQRLEVEIRNVQYGVRRRLGLILLDIDNFQTVNDAYGHEAGDGLIVDMAKRLASFLPERAFVSRQGGDEFAILLPGLNDTVPIEQHLRRLMKVCEAPFSVQGDEIRIGISVGATMFSKDLGVVSDKLLFKQADTALFRAKTAGRNGYALFESHMEATLRHQVTLLSDLRQALEQEQLFLVYQPQLNLSNEALVGAEVLLRWEHPTRGMISPAEFIPLAEAHGLIGELGNYVMKTAIRQIADWQRRFGRTIRLAVNVSPRQFSEPNFVRQVASLLRWAGVEGRWLELEITESVLASDLDQAVRKLAQLRDLEVTMAVDDFGTGFSNLASLKRYPVDLLKIDRSFVQGLPEQENDIAIVNAIIQMAKAMGLKLLAEGVETTSQRDHLRAFQCDYAQGFLFAKPMSLESFEAEYLQNDRAGIMKAP